MPLFPYELLLRSALLSLEMVARFCCALAGVIQPDSLLVVICLVCTTTIWMGHLAKTVKQAQIMGAFEDFGLVKSVDVSHFDTIFLVPNVFFLNTFHVSHSLNCVADIVYICAAVGSGSWLCIHSDDAPC